MLGIVTTTTTTTTMNQLVPIETTTGVQNGRSATAKAFVLCCRPGEEELHLSQATKLGQANVAALGRSTRFPGIPGVREDIGGSMYGGQWAIEEGTILKMYSQSRELSRVPSTAVAFLRVRADAALLEIKSPMVAGGGGDATVRGRFDIIEAAEALGAKVRVTKADQIYSTPEFRASRFTITEVAPQIKKAATVQQVVVDSPDKTVTLAVKRRQRVLRIR